MGLITPLGTCVEETWRSVLAGRTGLSRHERSCCPEHLQYYGKVEGYERPDNIPKSIAGQVRFLNRGAMLGFEAAREAVQSSMIDLDAIPKERRSLFVASGDLTKVGYEFMHPALDDATKQNKALVDRRVMNRATMDKVNPFFLLESISNNLFSFLSAMYEFMGPNTSMASLSPCGGNALELACRRIRTGEADIALAVGCGNWITEIPMYEMDGLGILSKCKKGLSSFRPMDKCRDGFIPGEGGAAILLEDAERAKRRGAPITALINGLGNCIEPPGGKGLSVPDSITRRSIEAALAEGSFEAGDLAFICPHGSGTRKGDRSELQAITGVLGQNRSNIPVCALKPYTGHMGAASDICEVVLGIKAISEGIVPATPNFAKSDTGYEDLRISSSTQQAKGHSFLSISYGIIGQSSCVLVENCVARP